MFLLLVVVEEDELFAGCNAAGLPVAALKKRDRLPVNPRGPNGLYNFLFNDDDDDVSLL